MLVCRYKKQRMYYQPIVNHTHQHTFKRLALVLLRPGLALVLLQTVLALVFLRPGLALYLCVPSPSAKLTTNSNGPAHSSAPGQKQVHPSYTYTSPTSLFRSDIYTSHQITSHSFTPYFDMYHARIYPLAMPHRYRSCGWLLRGVLCRIRDVTAGNGARGGNERTSVW